MPGGAAGDVDVVDVGRVLAGLDLVTAFGHVSRRTSADAYRITAPGDLGRLADGDTVTVDLTAPELPPGAPGEAWLHTAVYRARPDVGAVVRAQPVAAFAAASACDELPVLHGQAAWLGAPVPVHPVPRLLRSADLAAAAAATLGPSGAMLLRANGAVAVGPDVAVAATRMWLLSVACDVWLRARAAGEPSTVDAEDLRVWAAAGESLLPRLWEHLVRRAGPDARPAPLVTRTTTGGPMTTTTHEPDPRTGGTSAAEAEAAQRLVTAVEEHRPCLPVRDLIGADDVLAAYRVQSAVNARRTERTGARPVGRKIGLTSPAVQRQLGVGQPDHGVLFADMGHPSGGTADAGALLQPRVEAEVAFVLARDVDSPVTAGTIGAYVQDARAALEIVDSRIAGWDITLADTIADNASSGGYVVAEDGVPVAGVDLAAVRMSMTEDGVEVSAGVGADCLGSPLAALAWLANTTRELGSPLRAGEVVLSGALGPMVPVRPGAGYAATVSGVGRVEITFTDPGSTP